MSLALTTQRQERRWLTLPVWQVWRLPTLSLAYVTPWLTSLALITTCRTALPMIDEVIRFNCVEDPTKMGTFPQYKYPQALKRYADVATMMGLKCKTDMDKVEALIAEIDKLKKAVGIKDTIKDYGVEEEKFLANLDQMVEDAFDDQCTGANPRYPLMKEIKQMYLNAYYGKKK